MDRIERDRERIERDRDNIKDNAPQRGMPGRRIGSGRIITRTSRPSVDSEDREPGQTRRIERESWDRTRDRDIRDRDQYHSRHEYDGGRNLRNNSKYN